MSSHNRHAASRACRAEAAWRRRAVVVVLLAACVFAGASTAFGQTAAPAPTSRFVMGPLQWAPTLQLREAGIDSNVFNTHGDVKEDMTGTFAAAVDTLLTLGIARVATQGGADYLYFEQQKSQRALNGRVNSRITLPLSRIQPVVTVSWARAKERTGNEIDIRAPRTDHAYGASLVTKVTSRVSLSGSINRQFTIFDSGVAFRGVDLATQLNRVSTSITTGLEVAISPLTSFSITGGVSRDGFTAQQGRNTDNFRGDVGLAFAPDAIIGGHASVGYHRMRPEHVTGTPGGALEQAGLTAAVDLSYTLLGVTRFNPRFARDTAYSISSTQPFYVSNAAGLEVTQALFGPLELVARGGREELAYPATDLAAARTDRVDTLGGGLSFRLSTSGRISLNYDDAKRRSNAESDFSYSRRRIYTSVTYGF
jgi:hypothetical protein